MEQPVENPQQQSEATPDEQRSMPADRTEVAAESGPGAAQTAAAEADSSQAEPVAADAGGDREALEASASQAKDAEVKGSGSAPEPGADASEQAPGAGSEVVADSAEASAETDAGAEAAVAVAAAATPEPAPEPPTAATDGKPHKRVLTGTVVSNGSEQGIVVRISHRKKHRLYKKYRTLSRKVMAHDPGNDCEVGDLVRVIESRPLSKMKRWRLIEIVKRAG